MEHKREGQHILLSEKSCHAQMETAVHSLPLSEKARWDLDWMGSNYNQELAAKLKGGLTSTSNQELSACNIHKNIYMHTQHTQLHLLYHHQNQYRKMASCQIY